MHQKILIKLKNYVEIDKNQVDSKLQKFLQQNLQILNSEFSLKEKLGLSLYGIQKYFDLLLEKQDSYLLPRGFLRKLLTYLQENNYEIELLDKRTSFPFVDYKAKIPLFDYQQKVIDKALQRHFGIIVAPPGAGKTVMALDLISKRGQPSLILVHRRQLLEQWQDRIESFLKIPKSDIGEISGKKKQLGQKITVSTMQSMLKMDLNSLSNKFGLILVDECHHIPAKTFRQVIVSFNSYYLYGLTATPQRKNNDEQLIFLYLGEILARIDNQDLEQERMSKGDFSANSLEIIIKKTDLEFPFDMQIDPLELAIKVLIYDSHRNLQICQDIYLEASKNKKILVLTERKDHVQVLAKYLLERGLEVVFLTGDDNKKTRVEKLKLIENKEFEVMVTTGQLFGEGSDFNAFNRLFLVYPFSFEGKLIQYIGRIQRSKEEKIVYDYRDHKISYFEKMFLKRQKYYQTLN
jgi:superfamily II DNA or RNA helicase